MHSIRFRIAAFIVAVFGALLVLLNTYPITSSRDMVFEEKKNSMSARAAVVSSSLSGLDRLSSESVSEVLRMLDMGSMDRTVVADTQCNVLYDSSTGSADFPEIETAVSGKTVFRSDFTESAFESCCAVPVAIQGEIAGAVYLYERDTERAEIISSLQARIRTISLIIAGASIFVMFVFSELLLSRLRNLVSSMRVVASGNYRFRHQVTGKDELSELGNEFNRLTECLDENEQQRRRFVSDASHELKTPLASIRLLTDSIVQTENMDSDTMREFVTDIGNEAERLQRTTEKLLNLSRIDDGVQVVPEPVDVKQVIVDALSVLTPLAAERSVKFHCELDDGCVVMATVDDMFRIVFNLMENAVKYNVPDGSVTVTLHSGSDSVVISVSDTGIGIPEEDRLNIFARFYRVDKARSREAGGSGLGLSIVHDAVLLHGGTITVGPNKPQGSVFYVSFPRPSDEETGI